MHHMWVAISYVPIEIELLGDGSLNTSTTELADDIAREESVLGCWHCMTPLDTDTYFTDCSGTILTGP